MKKEQTINQTIGQMISLQLKISQQMTGIQNHLRNITESHRRIETNTERAKGHLQEAIRLSLKLRRLRIFYEKLSQKTI